MLNRPGSIVTITAAACIALAAGPLPVAAAVSADRAALLGGAELTPLGAERGGNAAGTIPSWQPLTALPAGFTAGKPLVDPFADEQPLFTITAANIAQHRDHLTSGQIALLEAYPDSFRMPVYPGHRIAEHPQQVYDKVKANATVVATVAGGNGLTNNASDFPFPLAGNGVEAIWNHIVRYRGGSVRRTSTEIPVQRNGSFSVIVFEDQISWANVLDGDIDANRLFFYKQRIRAPARLEGNVLLVHENIDQVLEPRAAWIYNAGQRRVRRAPDVAYDGPGMTGDGLRTADDMDMFNGAVDPVFVNGVARFFMQLSWLAFRQLVHPSVGLARPLAPASSHGCCWSIVQDAQPSPLRRDAGVEPRSPRLRPDDVGQA
jgi:hypothetical protein